MSDDTPTDARSKPTDKPRSLAVSSSWTSVGLAFGCAGLFLLGLVANQISPFELSTRGLLTGIVPRAGLYVLWAGEALAAVIGIVSFLLIRRDDIASKAIIGIVARSLCGVATGIVGTVVLWLIVGHLVIGF